MSEAQQSSAESSSFFEWLLLSQTDHPTLRRQGQLAAAVLAIAELLTLAALVISLSFQPTFAETSLAFQAAALALVVVLFLLFLLNRSGRTLLAGTLLSIVILAVDIALLRVAGPLSPVAVTLVVPVILAGLFGPPFAAVVIAFGAGFAYLGLNLSANPAYAVELFRSDLGLQTGLVYLNLVFVAVMSWLFSRTTREALNASYDLELAMIAQREALELRLAAQTRQLQATVTVARAVAGQRDLDTLLADTVRLVQETFDYYHVQVFLTDDEERYAVLRQSTGEVGEMLITRGHRLAVGSLSVIGQVTSTGRPVVARDTDKDSYHRRNELLPRTRSEMAIPLIVADRVIGALDLQSLEPDAFDADTIPTLQALADQLAIAIENARLFEQTQENLRELRELSRDTTRESWAEFLNELHGEERSFVYGPETKTLATMRSQVVERILTAGATIVSNGKDGRQSFIAAPLVVRNEVIGIIGVEPDGPREWTRDDLQLIEGIAERTAAAIENARLYIQAQRAADRERLINTISSRLQRSPSLALLLENAVRELGEVLGTDNVYAEINVDRPLAGSRDGRDDGEDDGMLEGDSRPADPVPEEESQALLNEGETEGNSGEAGDALSGTPEEAKAER
jgi:GAF domain-containing protein/cbb3-type cytochrome oxidase subunit 3